MCRKHLQASPLEQCSPQPTWGNNHVFQSWEQKEKTMTLLSQTFCSSDHEFNITLNNTETSLVIREKARYETHFTYTNVEADKISRSFMIKTCLGLGLVISEVIQLIMYMANGFQVVMSKLPRKFHLLLSFASPYSESHTKLPSGSGTVVIKQMMKNGNTKNKLTHSCHCRTKDFKHKMPQPGVAKNGRGI